MSHFTSLTRAATSTLRQIKGLAFEQPIRRRIAKTSTQFSETCNFVVFFADPVSQIYQLSQWIKPLEALADREQSVGFVILDPFVARELATRTKLPILLTRSMEFFQDFLTDKQVKVVFYVNNSQANFTSLRNTSPTHIHLNHGESDKISMVSNQLKAYDFAFVAGDAAVQRIRSVIRRFNVQHLVKIGRPQIDSNGVETGSAKSDRVVVLYAPTWEGDSRQMAYSSLLGIGSNLTAALLADDRFTVHVRPHPKTGTWSDKALQNLRHIEALIRKANQLDPAAQHRIDRGNDATRSLVDCDVVIGDNSAMTMDAVGLDKPVFLVVSEALKEQSRTIPSIRQTIESLINLGSESLPGICDAVASAAVDPIPTAQEELRHHVFGSPELGTGTERFILAAIRAADDGDETQPS